MYHLSDTCNAQLDQYWDQFPADASTGAATTTLDGNVDQDGPQRQ